MRGSGGRYFSARLELPKPVPGTLSPRSTLEVAALGSKGSRVKAASAAFLAASAVSATFSSALLRLSSSRSILRSIVATSCWFCCIICWFCCSDCRSKPTRRAVWSPSPTAPPPTGLPPACTPPAGELLAGGAVAVGEAGPSDTKGFVLAVAPLAAGAVLGFGPGPNKSNSSSGVVSGTGTFWAAML